MNIKLLTLAAILMLVSSMANAGRVQGHNVEINNDENFARGNMRQARFSKNDYEHIGCRGAYINNAYPNHHGAEKKDLDTHRSSKILQNSKVFCSTGKTWTPIVHLKSYRTTRYFALPENSGYI